MCGLPWGGEGQLIRTHLSPPAPEAVAPGLLTAQSCIPDYHLDGVDTHAQAVSLRDGVGDTPTAVGHQCVQVQPLPRGRLRHDVHIHLGARAGWS